MTASTLTADGLTTYRVDFGVAAVDIQSTGGVGGRALLFNLVRNGTILGIIGDFNLPTGSSYAAWPAMLSVFDTPPAGSVSYEIAGLKVLTGTATATILVYGSDVGPPFVGVTHPGFISVEALVGV